MSHETKAVLMDDQSRGNDFLAAGQIAGKVDVATWRRNQSVRLDPKKRDILHEIGMAMVGTEPGNNRAHIPGWSEDDRRAIGAVVYRHFVQGRSREDAAKMYFDLWAEAFVSGALPLEFFEPFATSSMQAYALQCGHWYASNFSKVILDPNLAASLMATKVTSEVVDAVVAPWKTFVIDVSGLDLPYVTAQGDERALHTVSVEKVDRDGKTFWHLMLFAGKWNLLGQLLSPADLVDGDVDDVIDRGAGELGKLDSADAEHVALGSLPKDLAASITAANARVFVAVQRLVVGVCLTMSDPTQVTKVKPAKKKPTITPKHLRGLPVTQTYQVGRPVVLDCKKEISDWVRGRRGTSPTVRVLVRGHWKMQPHGPGSLERKVIQVAPYWRGDEHMPKVVRAHELRG